MIYLRFHVLGNNKIGLKKDFLPSESIHFICQCISNRQKFCFLLEKLNYFYTNSN